MLSRALRQTNWKTFGMLAGMVLVIALLWNTPVVYPLKILVVLFHELSHGLAAYLTGGRMTQINLSSMQGGTCWSIGGSRFVVLSAGYLGSLIWGAVLLTLAARTNLDRVIAGVLGGIILLTGLIFTRPLFSFGWFFCLAAGLALVASGVLLPTVINDFILKLIGLTSCLYAPMDILSDLVFRSVPGSDAYALGEITFIPAIVWGVFWWLAAMGGAIFALFLSTRKGKGEPAKGEAAAAS